MKILRMVPVMHNGIVLSGYWVREDGEFFSSWTSGKADALTEILKHFDEEE